MCADIHWVSGPWQGKLCIGPRPRGDDWLDDDIARLRSKGIDAILSLLTAEEGRNLGLLNEGSVAKTHGITFISCPIPDMHVPSSSERVSNVVAAINAELSEGRNVFIHCRQGIGRTGLIAACLLLKSGWTPQKAMEHVSAARGLPVPETEEQRRWIHDYASRQRPE
jgi:protein-tyrosine phosphatase